MSKMDFVNEFNNLSDLEVDNLIEVWKESFQEVERLSQLEQKKIE